MFSARMRLRLMRGNAGACGSVAAVPSALLTLARRRVFTFDFKSLGLELFYRSADVSPGGERHVRSLHKERGFNFFEREF